MCQGLAYFNIYFCHSLWVVFLSCVLWGWSCITPLSSIGILLGLLYIGRGVATEPNVLWSTPFPTQESTFGVILREFPWMLKWVVLSKHIFWNQQSVFYTAPHLKVVYNQAKICKQTCRSTHASQMLVGLVSVDNPKFWYLQGSWFLVVWVLHLTGAGWSGLSCSVVVCRWCWSWRGVIFDSFFSSICFILPHVRVDG